MTKNEKFVRKIYPFASIYERRWYTRHSADIVIYSVLRNLWEVVTSETIFGLTVEEAWEREAEQIQREMLSKLED